MNRRNIILLLSLLVVMMLPLTTMADDIPIRYVKTSGSYGADGKSWASAKNNVQEALDALYTYMTENKISEGRLYIAAGTYYPSASTETGNDNRQHLSFIIYPGIHVYGGFKEDENNDDVDPNSEEARPHAPLTSLEIGSQQVAKQQPWNYQYKTILSGDLSDEHKTPSFTYDDKQGTYKTIFYGNSYHVVWFATNGFINATKDTNYGWDESTLSGHARALPYPSSIDGCTITGGYAANQSNAVFEHTGYGAGVYMVEGARLSNCIVEKCLAVTNGGGVYMDGGGEIEGCYINTCQATGNSVLDGLGGGVCINFSGSVKRSYIVNNSGRSGGGLAICHLPNEYPWRSRAKEDGVPAQQINSSQINIYSPFAAACIVSNNSSTNEAGGVFLNSGGVVNHITITNNKCYGSDVLYYGRRQGRSGGAYILNGGQIFNSVVWGNKCDANNDIQYACHITESNEILKPQVYYSGFEKYESTDWSGTTKSNVYSLESTNLNATTNSANYPYFIGIDGQGTINGVGAGLTTIPRPISWKPAAISSLVGKGVQVTNTISGISEWIRHAHVATDIFGDKYDPISSIGALTRRDHLNNAAMVANQEKELYADYEGSIATYTSAVGETHSLLPDAVGGAAQLPTLFVDPRRKIVYTNNESDIHIGDERIGSSWEQPLERINDAIDYFRSCQITNKEDAHYLQYKIGDNYYPYVQILVKGAVGSAKTTTAGLNAYTDDEVRTAAIRPCSNMRLYGGYPPDATGTSTSGRNQRQHPTRITANVMNGDYANNSAHVFVLQNVKNVIIDGFRIYEANANFGSENKGAGILIDNESVAESDRIDMDGNIFRNSNITHCSAQDGAAIYVNAGGGTEAEIHLMNIVVRNNTVTDISRERGGGVVVARGAKAIVRMDHCNLVNNCGYPIATISTDGTEANEGKILIYNSVIYANANEILPNRKNIVQSLCYYGSGTEAHLVGDYMYLDWDNRFPLSGPNIHRIFCRDLSDHYQKWVVRMYDTDGYTIIKDGVVQKFFMDTEADALAKAETAPVAGSQWSTPILTEYPFFVNPSRNVGHSVDGDKPMNGGTIDYMPQATNPMVNAAIDQSRYLWDTDNNPRTYGGDPDIGAVESTELPLGGTVIYVTPNGAGKKDGSSWANAIAGNTVYKIGESYVTENNQPVTTSDRRYRGGFAVDYVYQTGTTTYTDNQTITYKNVFATHNINGSVTTTEEVGASVSANSNYEINKSNKLTKVKSEYIYGEKSGASRGFYRTNLKDGYVSNVPITRNNGYELDGTKILVSNTREEDYVSGLQFAVEKAAAINKDKPEKSDYVQVWVGNGTYTDFKGFVMRDKVSVYGGFPASTMKTPGNNERHALVSEEIPLSNQNSSLKDNKGDYETILQVQNLKPYNDDYSFNQDVLKQDSDHPDLLFQDKDYTESGNKTFTTATTVTIPLLTVRNPIVEEENITDSKIPNSTFDTNMSGWTVESSLNSTSNNYWSNKSYTYSNVTIDKYLDLWISNTGPGLGNGKAYYNVGSLEQGTYRFEADAVGVKQDAASTGNIPATPADNVYLFWTSDLNNIPLANRVQVKTGNRRPQHFSVDCVLTESATVYFGLMTVDVTEGEYRANWMALDNVKLYKRGFLGNYEEKRERAYNVESDCTTKLTNPSFEVSTGSNVWSAPNAGYGWNVDGATVSYSQGSTNKTVHGADITPGTNGFYQELEAMEEGLYRISCQGFIKSGSVKLFANGVEQEIQSLNNEDGTPNLSTAIDLFAAGKYNENWVDVYVGEAGYLRFGLKGTGRAFCDNFRLERLAINPNDVHSSTIESGTLERSSLYSYSTIRKPVLFMPDVCMTTYWPGKINNNDNTYSNKERAPQRASGDLTPTVGSGFTVYSDVLWDGFTIRNGFNNDYYANRDGGAGVRMFEGGTLQNCVVVDNGNMGAIRSRGGGAYCDGKTSKIISCFFINNLNSGKRTTNNDHDTNGGGIYLLVGTCYNSLFANNICWGEDSRGAGIYIESATFFNNTVAYNLCIKRDGTYNTQKGNGVHQYEGTMGATLNVYNTIFYKNSGPAIGSQNEGKLNSFRNCYIQTEIELSNTIQGKFVDCEYGKKLSNPFELGDDAKTLNNYRLAGSSSCVNAGMIPEDQAATFPPNDVDFAERVQDCQVDIGAYEYDGAMSIHPGYELIDFVDKDGNTNKELCAVYYATANGQDSGDSSGSSPENAACASKLQDILDAAGRLKYDLANISHKNEEGYVRYSASIVQIEGTVTANEEVYNSESSPKTTWVSRENQNLTNVKHVIVKLADGVYMPERSTNNKMAKGDSEDEILTHSLIIPHGVEVWGGYKFDNTAGDFFEYTRDILNHKSILYSGVKDKRSGTIGKAYHVVTFTNHLFQLDGSMYHENDNEAELIDMADRSILDGVFIQGGSANGVNDADRYGGGAVVAGYAHIRNSIIYDNTATKQGGGLYLMPSALVSGCIFKDNSSDEGGAIYVSEPPTEMIESCADDDERDELYARVYNSTIVNNTASIKGGGIFFETNIRAKGVVLWQNTANDLNNVAGTFDSEAIQEERNYPFSYCTVQNRRLPGVNNQEVPGDPTEGVRWTTTSNETLMYWRGQSTTAAVKHTSDNSFEYKDFNGFYYTDRVSALVRTGMPYSMYKNLRKEHPTLELVDLAGVSRMDYTATDDKGGDYKCYFGESNELVTKTNKYLEIGARALNTQMELEVDKATVHMTRLFVAKPENVDADNANKLLTSDDPLYSLQGSSMANPFTKFSDALDYIVKLRNYKKDLTEGDDEYADAAAVRQKYANTHFEIFVGGGYYYPYQNPEGEEGNARSSTFVLPEGVTIVGGLDPTEMYCQAGYDYAKNQSEDAENNDKAANDFLDDTNELANKEINGVTLERASTDVIREARDRFDLNNNNVFEPWEFQRETVFSGSTPRGNENEDNVFHVFTCFADPAHVGTLPTRYKDNGTPAGDNEAETDASLRKRMIILDGLTVKDGNARDYEQASINNKKMFYRGGGILIDGSWSNAAGDSDEPDNNPNAKGIRDIPMTISDCLFQENNAIQGGAIFTNGTLNVFSSSFVKNYSQGPKANVNQTGEDRGSALDAIQYAGGGAIATTADLFCTNTIFANNEAMLGDTKDMMLSTSKGYYQQGFGGVIWGANESTVRLLNCNLVNNQAVSYPCVYLANPNKKNDDMRHFAVNTVFWGNNKTGVPASLSGSFSHITEINDDVMKFRGMTEKRNNSTPEGVETMYFCAYEANTGPQDKKQTTGEPHAKSFTGWSNIREVMKDNDTYYNNNVIIKSDNDDVDGPNFQLPSPAPGVDGYNASANWMASRVNKLTDNGWSYLTVGPNDHGEMVFKVEDDAHKAYQKNPGENDNTGGIFNQSSYDYYTKYDLNLMPLGSVDAGGHNYYMKFNGTGMTDQMSAGGQSYMLRISSNPLTRETYKAYIDIGVYEYQHRTLKINQGSEIDVIWVTEKENPQTGNDGYSWETATSNIQVAIETLLKSRNNHGKRLNIIAGNYKPMTVVNGNLGYTIQTSAYNDGVYTPFKESGDPDPYGVKYINLRGGYDKQIPDEGGYDYQKNQVVFSMEQRTGVEENQLNHILNIAEVEQYNTTVTKQIDGFTVASAPTGKAIPIIIEGITFENPLAQGISESNPGGAAILYNAQKKHDVHGDETNDDLEAPADDAFKLTIRNCTFSSNGKEVANPSSAIRIEDGGGQALIVNSVFHSNKGKPVDAVNTVVLNCTSAMNGGHITLSGDDSELHNSVIWQDDQSETCTKHQYQGVEAGSKMTYNAITGMPADDDHNEPLSDTNNDLEEGPNFLFMNPNDEDPSKRDFRIRPSLRLLDRGSNEKYAQFVWKDYISKADITVGGVTMKQYMALMQNIHPDQTELQDFTTKIRNGDEVQTITYRGLLRDKDLDRAFVSRLMNADIDRGAYECTGKGQRIVYVNPEKFGTGMESGSTWEDALGRGNLQRAIDAAAVYVRNRETKAQQDPAHYTSQIAYVFVKGDNMYNEGEITLRDGVHVYGTAPISVEINEQTNEADADYETYLTGKLNEVKSERLGIVFKSMKAEFFTPTYCGGLVSMGEYRLGSVFDGLMINNGLDNTAEKPIVNIAEDAKIVIRNCLVIHNRVGPDKNGQSQSIVNLQGGLMYNTLIYNCYNGDDGYVVKVGQNGYVLNSTIIADDTRQRAITTGTLDYDTHVANTITINQGASQKMFAPYMKAGGNQYTPEDFLTNHRPYWYQLHENSSEIDAATKQSDNINDWLPTVTTQYNSVDYPINYDDYVDFEHDRDLLGNPRKINGVDNGCFETWKITGTVEAKKEGHFYPHPGSVVYIGEGANLKLKSGDFTIDNPIVPGYLLVKQGGSLYGQGNHITATYVAVEKKISSQYSLVSVPFRCNPLSTVAISYPNAGEVVETKPSGFSGSTYDGEERSKWNYHYQAENSTCWVSQNDFIPANKGWLLSLSAAPGSETIFRFTGWGESQTSYIYTEDGNAKTVTLTQHNSLPDDGSAHFTKQENMGWNLVGLPWLVSGYKTKNQMSVPHIIYGNLGNTAVANQFYTGQSWGDDVALSPGDGFFTQTAVFDDTETLTFTQPVYTAPAPSRRGSQCIAISRGSCHDVVSVYPADEADASLTYHLGSDGLKWKPYEDHLAQIFVENSVGTRMSLVSAAPVGQEMSLGISVPEAGDYVISLPDPEAYSDYDAVWVTDTETGQSVNLLSDGYVLSASEAGDITGRLKLKFGGLSANDAMPSVMKVAARDGRLHLRGIAQGEQIRVYSVNGVLVYSGVCGDVNNLHLQDGVYIIKR